MTSVTETQSHETAGQAPAQKAGRVALVTGGNRGIGRGIAERMQAAGYRVAVTYRSGIYGVP